MKILLTTDTFYPMINGVVISTHNLYKELKKLGHDVRILTLAEDGKERIVEDIYYLKSIRVKIYPGAKIKRPFNTETSEEILKWNPDIIHSQTEFSTMLNAKYIARKLKIPHVHTYHTMYEDYLHYVFGLKTMAKMPMRKAIKLLLNSVDKVIAPTEKVKKSLEDYDVKTDIDIVPTGIDLSNFQKTITSEEKSLLLKANSLSYDDKIILYLGRIAEEKNIEEIINMFANLQGEYENLKLLIVGKGPHLDYLINLSKQKNMENKVRFTGMVDPSEVYKYYSISHAFVTASTSETQGLTYIEALSCGLPVICRYDPCIDGVIEHGKNGLVYTNESEFKEAVKSIVLDETYKNSLSQYAKASSEKYSSKAFAKAVEKIYINTIKEKFCSKVYTA